MNLKFKRLHPDAKLPARAYNSAGYDLWSVSSGEIPAGGAVSIPLGFATSFDPGIVAIIDDKSGTGKAGLCHLAGVIDSDYRGEWVVIMHNISDKPYLYTPAKSIAQVLFLRFEKLEVIEVQELEESERGEKKFGSSGH